LAAAVLLALGTAVLRADQPARPIEISAPINPKSSDIATNIDSEKSKELREELINQQLRHQLFRPYNGDQSSQLEGMFMPPSQPALTEEQAKKLKELMDKEKYWAFATSDDNSESNSSDVFNDSGNVSDFESDEPKALKRFFDHNSGNPAGKQGTNSVRDAYGRPKDDAITNPLDGSKANNPEGRGAFSSGPAGNSIINRLFDSPASQDAGRDSSGVGGQGLFSGAFSQPVQDDREVRAAEDQHRQAFQEMLNSTPASTPAGYSSAASSLPAVTGGSSAFSGMNNPDNGAASALSGLSQESISGPASAPIAPAIAPPAPSMMPFTPIEPPRRVF
jgi:hypothetical protein